MKPSLDKLPDTIAQGNGRRTVRKGPKLERTTWALVSLLLVLLVIVVIVFERHDNPSAEPDADHLADSKQQPIEPVANEQPKAARKPKTVVPKRKPPKPRTVPSKQQDPKDKATESIAIDLKPKAPPSKEPAETPPERAEAEPQSEEKPADIPPPPEAILNLAEASFLTSPLPQVASNTAAPGRPVTLLKFPRPPEDFKLDILGLKWINTASNPQGDAPQPELASTYSDADQTLTIHTKDDPASQAVATFFLQKNELRFKWKPRASLSKPQQLIRAYAVLHITWKGHPGRYYALHEPHVRDARRIRNQQVRLRPSELPNISDPDNLYLGQGKLEIAEVYSHRFLVTPKSKRLEVPTITRSRKDPPIFIRLEWTDRSLVLKLDSPVNSEGDAKRRRRLFEHVDGNFHLHGSVYRVVDDRVRVEVLRLGSP